LDLIHLQLNSNQDPSKLQKKKELLLTWKPMKQLFDDLDYCLQH